MGLGLLFFLRLRTSPGGDPEKFNAAISWYGENTPHGGSRELIIIRRGRVIWEGPDTEQVHNVWSCTKTFTSTVLGLLIDEGLIALESRVADVLPELQANYPGVTYRHFTTMTSGYQAEEDSPPFGTYVNGPSNVWWRPAPNPLSSGDADCSGAISISDAVYLIQYIFSGGPMPCEG